MGLQIGMKKTEEGLVSSSYGAGGHYYAESGKQEITNKVVLERIKPKTSLAAKITKN